MMSQKVIWRYAEERTRSGHMSSVLASVVLASGYISSGTRAAYKSAAFLSDLALPYVDKSLEHCCSGHFNKHDEYDFTCK